MDIRRSSIDTSSVKGLTWHTSMIRSMLITSRRIGQELVVEDSKSRTLMGTSKIVLAFLALQASPSFQVHYCHACLACFTDNGQHKGRDEEKKTS